MQKKKINILFTSVGRRVVLLRLFKKAINELNIDGNIIAVDTSENSAARYAVEQHFTVPKATDQNYISKLLNICKGNSVDILIPLIDTELILLAENKHLFKKIGTTVLISSLKIVEISSDKRKTYQFFRDNNFATPKLLDVNDKNDSHILNFPCFVKPANGSSSINAFKVNSREELNFFTKYVPNALVQEFVSGEEYTLDILSDFSGKVHCVVPRLRIATRAGEISKGITVKNLDIINAGKRLAETLPGAVGCITVQCFLTKAKQIKFIEINPRFGGGFPLSCEAGANFPLWILQMYLGENPDIKIDGWEAGIKMLRYDDAIYLRA